MCSSAFCYYQWNAWENQLIKTKCLLWLGVWFQPTIRWPHCFGPMAGRENRAEKATDPSAQKQKTVWRGLEPHRTLQAYQRSDPRPPASLASFRARCCPGVPCPRPHLDHTGHGGHGPSNASSVLSPRGIVCALMRHKREDELNGEVWTLQF